MGVSESQPLSRINVSVSEAAESTMMAISPSQLQRRVGLARALSKLGFCSRSTACELIRQGRVQLNRRVRHDPETPVKIGRDRVLVDGSPIQSQRFVYFMLNKPRGIVSTASDEKNRETVYSLLSPELPWVAPVGRLDKASEGLLLMTNDSEWAARITAPASKVEKVYHVQIGTMASQQLLQTLQNGVRTDKDETLRVVRAEILRSGSKNTWIEITLEEGKNRHLRRMFEALSIEVLRLMRVRIGPLRLGELKKGGVRPLTEFEKQQLDAAIRLS